eukprot:TRINITY_DN6531_c0_g1_i1.p1 TRINITY_DN6531_c0_g1~~TRINITY_DN6531_c0_g1_i1.p1  ORF type:complete len:834 (-),score=246.07 TRINITY_DN6531_c0_g1_i1:3415-5916(-)
MNAFDLLPEAEAPELYSHSQYADMNMDDGSAMDTDGSPEANIRALDAFSWPGPAQFDTSAIQAPYVSFQVAKDDHLDQLEYQLGTSDPAPQLSKRDNTYSSSKGRSSPKVSSPQQLPKLLPIKVDPMLAMYSEMEPTVAMFDAVHTSLPIMESLAAPVTADEVVEELTRPRKRAKQNSGDATTPSPAPAISTTRRAAAAQAIATTRAAVAAEMDEYDDADSGAPIVATATQARNRGVVSALLQKMGDASANGGAPPRKHKRKRGEVQKAKHNVAEKRRRSEMNEAIDRIKVLLPTKEDAGITPVLPNAPQQKPTKVSVLMDAAEYIESVQALCCQLAEENQSLQEDNSRLKSELAALRVTEQWSAGSSPVAAPTTGSDAVEAHSTTDEESHDQSNPPLSPSATRTYELSPSEVAALGVKSNVDVSGVIGSGYSQNFATMALLTVLFFTFWGNFLYMFDLNDAEYGISRVLLSIPSQPTFTTYLVHFFGEMCRALWGFFCWFRFVFVVYTLSAWRIKFMAPGSTQFEVASARLQEVQQMRSKMGTARTFKAARKLAKSLHREVPKSGFSLYLGLFVQFFRFISISMYFGYWIERLVLRIRGIRTQVAQAASVELNALHLLVDSFPETNTQFWYAALRLYNDATVYTADTGIVSQELLRVRVYKGIALRLRHHLDTTARWFGIFCDMKGSSLIESFMAKAAAGVSNKKSAKKSSHEDASGSDSSCDETSSDEEDASAEEGDDHVVSVPAAAAAAAKKNVSPSDQVMGIALATMNQLIADIDEGRFSKAEQNAMHLVQFFVDSNSNNQEGAMQRSMAWGKSRINLMVAFTQFCQAV